MLNQDVETTRKTNSVIVSALVIGALCFFAMYLSWGLVNMDKQLIDFYQNAHQKAAHSQSHDQAEQELLSVEAEEKAFVERLATRIQRQELLLYVSIGILSVACIIFAGKSARQTQNIGRSSVKIKEANILLESRLAAMELTHNGIFIVGVDGQLEYMNKRMMDIHKIPHENAANYLHKDWIDIYDPDIQMDIQREVSEQLYTHTSWNRIINIGNQHKKNVELILTKLPDGRLIGTCQDITQQNKANREKQDLQSQFYQAQKMEAIGRLAGGIAHDFNNILAAINGYAEFLIEDLEGLPPQQKFASKILVATQQARKLVDQILTFSRRNDVESESVDVLDIITESASMIKASTMGAIEVNKHIKLSSAIISGNSTQISQAVMNLCVNAIDAMEEGRGTLDLTVEPVDESMIAQLGLYTQSRPQKDETPTVKIDSIDKDRTILCSGTLESNHPYVCVTISDSGTGISRVVMEHVFEPFFTTKSVDKGTGLGLATVQGVVMHHQGAIIIDSTLGKGTTFHLYFPSSQNNIVTSIDETQKIGRFEFEGARILLVEDQNNVREMTSKMLQRMGFIVIEANNGLKGLEKLRAQNAALPFHLVLTDHNMPKMTGLEMIAEAVNHYPDMPFILLSGYKEEKLEDIMIEYPAIKSVLRKPIGKDALKQQIYAALLSAEIDLSQEQVA
jgi:signal transduction histidine kinase/CheY-like chemotaxis protein